VAVGVCTYEFLDRKNLSKKFFFSLHGIMQIANAALIQKQTPIFVSLAKKNFFCVRASFYFLFPVNSDTQTHTAAAAVETRVARRHIFKPKIPILVNFGGSCNGRCCYILWQFGLFYGHLVCLVAM
jgi:hypothetical protein